MDQPSPLTEPTKSRATAVSGRLLRYENPLLVALMAGFVLWAHVGSGVPVFRSDSPVEFGWARFRAIYDIDHFGIDGQFGRAVRNGFNLFYYTEQHAPRFIRAATGRVTTSCAGCHSVEDLAYSFVNSDRVDPKLGVRMSFEDRVRWCYANSLNGFVPTVYDPAVRDIRLLARAVARHLGLGEGARRDGA